MKNKSKIGYVLLVSIIIQLIIFVLFGVLDEMPLFLGMIFLLLFPANIVLVILYIIRKIKGLKISNISKCEEKTFTGIANSFKEFIDNLKSEEGIEPCIYEPEKISKNGTYEYDIKYNGVNIVINFNANESKEHLTEDYKVLEKEGIENLIKNQFMTWLKGEQFKDRDDNRIYDGLKLYAISYEYGKIIDKYSPTGEENYFGQFQFSFESSNEYTNDMLEAVAMEVYVLNGKIVKVSGYDI